MSFEVVLDTCTLYPAHLRDTLLRLAERGFYRPLWTDDILKELHRSLLTANIPVESVDRLLVEMRSAFCDAKVEGYHSLIDSMTCHPKDRHVLAAAVRSKAAAIITFNRADFPAESTSPFDIEIIHPDIFLLDLLDLAPSTVLHELHRQAAANRWTPTTLQELCDALAKAGVPEFAAEVALRRHSLYTNPE
ncbi:MAG: PIN domain-containing protein [Acidimicrobiaceae bacterium]|nr:PIN domain-containing protein [Acidimicrobiaceae bacterium]